MNIVENSRRALPIGRTVIGPFAIQDAAKSILIDANSFDKQEEGKLICIGLEQSEDLGQTWQRVADYHPDIRAERTFMRAGLPPRTNRIERLGRVVLESSVEVQTDFAVSNSITFGTVNSVYVGAGLSASVSVDAGADPDRVLACWCYSSINNFPSKDSFTYNSVSLSELTTNDIRVLFGYQINPDTGSHTLAVDLQGAGSSDIYLIGVPMFGVHQATPFGTLVRTTGSGSPITSSAITVGAGDVVVDFVRLSHTAGGGSLTKDASQTNLLAGSTPDGGANSYGVSYKLEATTMSWTGAQAGAWRHLAVPVKPSAAVGNPWYYYQQQ